MASGFGLEDPVLDFGPRRPKEHAKRVAWEYVLWPVWAYRVVAPLPRRRQLNLFQRALMGMCRGGMSSADEIAERLAVHRDLAAFILLELTELGYLDSYGIPTKRGLSVVAEDAEDDQELVSGFIFQDPWSGELWPRFVEELNYCELEFADSGFPQLVWGSKGKRRLQRAFMVLPADIPDSSRPTPGAVIRAISGQHRALKQVGDLSDIEDEHDVDVDLSPVSLTRVSFVEEQATPVFLVTYFYLADNVADSGDWFACDPFGMSTSNRLRRRVEQVMQTEPRLQKLLDRLVGRGLHKGLDEHRAWVERLRLQASMEVERRLSVNIRTSSAFGELVDMEFSHQEAMALGKECGGTKFSAALRSCLKSLEALFGAMAQDSPLGDIWHRVYVERVDRKTGRRYLAQCSDKQLNQAKIRRAAEQVGFDPPVPDSLLGVTPGQIRNVAQKGQHWRLRPLVAATLLKAREDEEHPLRPAAARFPGMLTAIDEVATPGAVAGHAGGSESLFDELNDVIEKTYRIATAMVGNSPAAETSASGVEGVDHGEA